MHVVVDVFLSNITLIISFMYLVLKLKQFIIVKTKMVLNYYILLVPLIIATLSIWVMHHPLFFEGMRIDLRSIPLFFISYLGGWKLGALSIVLPTWYRFDLGGPTVIQGVVQGIFLPFLIGAIFHRKKTFRPPYSMISIKHMMLGYMVYAVLKSSLMLWTTPANISTLIIMVVFEVFSLLIIGLINNDTNHNLLVKKELEFESRHDNMTNLFNLKHFKRELEKLIAQKKSLVIAMFDVDYFKNYNDTHGHPAGDSVLRTIGQLLSENMREEDVFARYGGEEFIICFSNVPNTQTASTLAEEFRKLVETYPFYGEEKQPKGNLTISMGLSSLSPEKSLDTLISEADQALYKAKQADRNTIYLYDSNK